MTHEEPTREEATRETRRVVDELLRRLGAGDHEGIAELFAEDFDWRLSWPERELEGDVPWIRERRTREEVAAHSARWRSTTPRTREAPRSAASWWTGTTPW